MRSRFWTSRRVVALLAVLALGLAACGGDDDDTTGDDGTEQDGGDGDAGGDGGEAAEATMLTAFTEDQDVAGVEAMIAAFEEANPNYTINHEGSSAFEEQALTRVEGGNPPDLIFHPQPGVLQDFADRGSAQPLDFLDTATIEEEFVPGLLDVGTFDGTLYGLQVRLSPKSLVWYNKPAFDEGGYAVPETWDDMIALSQEIADSGVTPWCVGIESGDATGWVFTDWVEDVMLRMHGPEAYDQWTTGELAFTSPEVQAAFEAVGEIWFEEGWVLGGRPNIVQTSFQSAPLPMFEDPPACMLHRQATFASQLFPEDAEFGTDYDFFLLPGMPDEAGNGVIFGGDLLALYTDNDAARAFIEFAATAEAQEAWAAEGSFVCANVNCSTDVYPSPIFAQAAEFLGTVDFARFDGSDLMPASVGAGAFWSESVQWVVDQQDLSTTLENIESAWPTE